MRTPSDHLRPFWKKGSLAFFQQITSERACTHINEWSFAMQEDMAALGSRLQADLGGMKRTMLEAVATGAVVTPDDVHRYASATLLAATQNFQVRVPTAACSAKRSTLHGLYDGVQVDQQSLTDAP